jgi:endonuclease I
VTKHISRLSRVEYEHVVPASKFGVTFDEWKFGSPICVKNNKWIVFFIMSPRNKNYSVMR